MNPSDADLQALLNCPDAIHKLIAEANRRVSPQSGQGVVGQDSNHPSETASKARDPVVPSKEQADEIGRWTSGSLSKVPTSDYYNFEDGNVLFLVENTLFKVHAFFFQRDSSRFKDLPSKAVCPLTNPIHLDNVTSVDFERFLGVLYPTCFDEHNAKTVEEWSSILTLATQWGFSSIRTLAIRELSGAASPVDKIALAHKFDVPEWLKDAYVDICGRSHTLALEEGERLGLPEVIKISEARELMRCRLGSARRQDLVRIVGRIFYPQEEKIPDPPTHQDFSSSEPTEGVEGDTYLGFIAEGGKPEENVPLNGGQDGQDSSDQKELVGGHYEPTKGVEGDTHMGFIVEGSKSEEQVPMNGCRHGQDSSDQGKLGGDPAMGLSKAARKRHDKLKRLAAERKLL
ncbi:hypothetical protein JAAARDRAFT_205981 [Jaapia argillacea MUCL 33604]|uniref:BTB domain-containing protein n=1 Tax=Jaapia argillacea MUCL 33604 TaxID=933084 RepID=A0A067Q8S7_9AGAM|nr:hypothetical protein JAAARDRAFT_205981 [Jaapia argillacea MUCL 33604]